MARRYGRMDAAELGPRKMFAVAAGMWYDLDRSAGRRSSSVEQMADDRSPRTKGWTRRGGKPFFDGTFKRRRRLNWVVRRHKSLRRIRYSPMMCRNCHERFPSGNGRSPRSYLLIAIAVGLVGAVCTSFWFNRPQIVLGVIGFTGICGGIAALGAAWTRTIDCCSAHKGRTTGGKRCPNCQSINPVRLWSA